MKKKKRKIKTESEEIHSESTLEDVTFWIHKDFTKPSSFSTSVQLWLEAPVKVAWNGQACLEPRFQEED